MCKVIFDTCFQVYGKVALFTAIHSWKSERTFRARVSFSGSWRGRGQVYRLSHILWKNFRASSLTLTVERRCSDWCMWNCHISHPDMLKFLISRCPTDLYIIAIKVELHLLPLLIGCGTKNSCVP